MNDISYSEDDFYIIFFVLGTILILVSVLWFVILDLQARRNRKMRITGTPQRNKIKVSYAGPGLWQIGKTLRER